MKRFLTFMLITLLTFSVTTLAQPEESPDEVAIRQNIQNLEEGWNTKSAALFAKPFAEDADYVIINGQYIKGRAVIENAHQQIFATIFKDTTLKLTVRQIRFLRPEVVVVHVEGHRDGPTKELVQDAMLTVVMTKEKREWTIAAFQNTAVLRRQ